MKVEWIALSLIGLMCAGVGTSFAEDDVPTHAVDDGRRQTRQSSRYFPDF